ncbi:Fic family protein [bacterium]|nr:Fic family protein [bacterium]
MTIKEQLSLIAKVSGKTQEKLAAELEVSFPTLNSWINGKSEPRQAAQQRIQALYQQFTGKNVIPETQLEGKKRAILHTCKQYPKLVTLFNTRKDLYDQFLLSLTYNTNRIEGSTLTEPETAAILFQNAALADKSLIEHMEVKNHQAAFSLMIQHIFAGKPITENFVLKLHAKLMNGIKDDAGLYRRHAVRIVGSHVPTANYLKLNVLMPELLKTIRAGDKDSIGFTVRIHSRFEQIHPFSDGNGRVGRLLLWAMLLQKNIAPAVIAQADRHYYIMYLNQPQLKEDYSRLEDFICDGILAGYALIG